MDHLLSIEALSADEITALINLGAEMKSSRATSTDRPLDGQCWAMLFSKSSTRTRVSFEVGIRELGGSVMFLSSSEAQLGRGEPIKDTARVLGRMVHGAVIRTFAQSDVEDFAQFSGIPTINALTDAEHPCQTLADLLTIREKLGTWENKKVVFYGDGDCNVARSWMWAAARLGFELIVAAPEAFQPPAEFVRSLDAPNVTCTDDPKSAAVGADVLYTDVWVSMGKEDESADRLATLSGYQIDDALVATANPGAIVMHCLPAYRGKEISEACLENHANTIFQQAENRLHAQKAVLVEITR